MAVSMMKMTPMVQTFVMHFGEMGNRWGINRTVGQILAILVIHEEPLNSEQIAEALSISRGNVSMGLKELQSWRLIKRHHMPGDRKEYYSSLDDIWTLGMTVLEERRKREVDPTLSLLRGALLDESKEKGDEYACERIKEIHDLLELLTNWTSDLQGMKPDNLKGLMKLGAGVSKVLDLKDKLLLKDNH